MPIAELLRWCRATGSSPRWLWVDPVCTFIFAAGVVVVTRRLVVDIMADLMERSPDDVAIDVLIAEMEALPGVQVRLGTV